MVFDLFKIRKQSQTQDWSVWILERMQHNLDVRLTRETLFRRGHRRCGRWCHDSATSRMRRARDRQVDNVVGDHTFAPDTTLRFSNYISVIFW